MRELPLGGGWSTDGVVRVGDTVRRPQVFATQLMRDLLAHLERVGFDAAPRWLGFDDQGRDVLSWVAGDTFSDCRAIVWSEDVLVAAARLYHDAVADKELSGDEDVVCHGDYGPWNLIWRDGKPFCIIDFDAVHPGSRAEDVGYALWKFLNLGLVDLRGEEQRQRAETFVAAYGIELDVTAAIVLAQEGEAARFAALGWPLDELLALRAWLAANF